MELYIIGIILINQNQNKRRLGSINENTEQGLS